MKRSKQKDKQAESQKLSIEEQQMKTKVDQFVKRLGPSVVKTLNKNARYSNAFQTKEEADAYTQKLGQSIVNTLNQATKDKPGIK